MNDSHIGLTIPKTLKTLLKAAAAKEALTMTEYVRKVLIQDLVDNPPSQRAQKEKPLPEAQDTGGAYPKPWL